MVGAQKDKIQDLRRLILSVSDRRPTAIHDLNLNWGDIAYSFPNKKFPLGAIHEFIFRQQIESSATAGFIFSILSGLMKKNAAAIWITPGRNIFPPALKFFDIDPSRIIFIQLLKRKELLWVMEEALKCENISAVVGEIDQVNFTESRRLQLAVEKSRVTGFLLRQYSNTINTIASVSRWRITHLPCETQDELPGIGFPRWNVELEKIRNGRPGHWQVEWTKDGFKEIVTTEKLSEMEKRMIG